MRLSKMKFDFKYLGRGFFKVLDPEALLGHFHFGTKFFSSIRSDRPKEPFDEDSKGSAHEEANSHLDSRGRRIK